MKEWSLAQGMTDRGHLHDAVSQLQVAILSEVHHAGPGSRNERA